MACVGSVVAALWLVTMICQHNFISGNFFCRVINYDMLCSCKRDSSKPKTGSSQSSKPETTSTSWKGSSRDQRRHPDKRLPTKNEDGLLKCYNCSQFSHISKNCLERQQEKNCKKCEQKGHTLPGMGSSNCVATISLVRTLNNKIDNSRYPWSVEILAIPRSVTVWQVDSRADVTIHIVPYDHQEFSILVEYI